MPPKPMKSAERCSAGAIIFFVTLIVVSSSFIDLNFTTILPHPFANSENSNDNVKDDVQMHSSFHPDQIPMLSANKTFVVTGANSGIGLSTVKILAKAGEAALVVMACRNMTKCNHARDSILSEISQEYQQPREGSKTNVCEDQTCAADAKEGNGDGSADKEEDRLGLMKTRLVAMHLDLSSIQSVRSFSSEVQGVLSSSSKKVESKPPALDVLINNGGIMGTMETLKDRTDMEKEGIEMEPHLVVNHLGHFALTSLLLPNLKHSNFGGRVVSVSSVAAALGPYALRFDDLDFTERRKGGIFQFGFIRGAAEYSVSKMANLLFSHGLHKRYASKSGSERMGTVTSVSAHPGYTRTNLVLSGWQWCHPIIGKIMRFNRFGSMHPDDGAMPQIRAALDVDGVKSDAYVGPQFYSFGRPIVLGTNMRSMHHLFRTFREEDMETLWKISEDAMGWSFDGYGQNQEK